MGRFFRLFDGLRNICAVRIFFLILSALFSGIPVPVSGQLPLIRNFPSSALKNCGAVWSVTQDTSGLILAGTNEGLLVYDGSSWRLTPAPGRYVRTLITAINGTVYYGTANDFGKLTKGDSGAFYFESLAGQLPPHLKMRAVFGAVETGGSVYLETQFFVIRIHTGTNNVAVIESPKFLEGLVVFNDRVIARSENGMAVIHPDDSITLYGSEENELPYYMGHFVFSDGTMYAVSPDENKIVRINDVKTGAAEAWEVQDPVFDGVEFYIKPIVSRALIPALGEEVVLLPTYNRGILAISQKKKVLLSISAQNGLLSNSVNSFYVDRDRNIWVCSQIGLSKIMTGSNIRGFSLVNGLPVPVRGVFRKGNRTFAATENGLFLHAGTADGFVKTNLPVSQVWSVTAWRDGILAAGGNAGVFYWKQDRSATAESEIATMAVRAVNDTLVFAGLFRGFTAFSYSDKTGFKKLVEFEDNISDCRSIEILNDGTVWVGTRFDGVFSFKLDDYLKNPAKTPPVTWYGNSEGLQELSYNNLFQWRDTLYTTDPKNVYAWNKGTSRFEKTALPFPRKSFPVFKTTADGRLWQLNSGFAFDGTSLDSSALASVPGILQDVFRNGDSLWAATTEGLFSVRTQPAAPAKKLPLQFRAVGLGALSLTDAMIQAAAYQEIEIPWEDRDVLFYFSSLYYVQEEQIVYETRLPGVDDDWVQTISKNHVRYTALPAGHHRFSVRASHPSGLKSDELHLMFRILPPWYAQPLLIGLYVVLLLGGGALSFIAYNNRLIRRNRFLEQSVEERTRELVEKNRELEIQTAALKKADELKSRFVNMAIHDMRNPLGAVAGYTDLLKEQCAAHPESLKLVDRIDIMVRQMLARIAGLLDTSRTGNGIHTFDIHPVAMEIISNNTILATRKNQILDADLDGPLFVEARPGDLKDAFDNLINNAIKFSPAGSRIYVKLYRLPEDEPGYRWMRFEVTDEGPGIPLTDHDSIFKPYTTLSTKPTAGETSSGLGLSIVKDIVELYGGRVWFNANPALRKGSTFYIDLPLARASGA